MSHSDSPLYLGVHHFPHLAAAVPHPSLIEQIIKRHQLVAVFILGVHIVVDSDVTVAHIIHHLLKGRAIEIHFGIAIVHIKSGVLEAILIGILLQDKFLERDLSRVFCRYSYNKHLQINRLCNIRERSSVY